MHQMKSGTEERLFHVIIGFDLKWDFFTRNLGEIRLSL
jgi:hypothetical protein